ncbi:MAG: invasion associated locus B family protein [Xanthobacteraceae bacterium]
MRKRCGDQPLRASTGWRICLFVFAALALSAQPDPAAAQGALRSVFGDWEIHCGTLPGAPGEQCSLRQQVASEADANLMLTVIVIKGADHTARLRVIAPLSVLLRAGVGLQIDQTNLGRTDFVRCYPDGCAADVPMDDSMVQQLRTGQTATFIIFVRPEEGIGFPISLKGFREGFDKLP